MNFDFSYPISLGKKRIEINDKIWIIIDSFKKRSDFYCFATLIVNGKKTYLGRYDNAFSDVKAQYKDGKIMLYHVENINGKEEIIKVLSLYEIIDETFYSCTEEEALDAFNRNIDKSYLKDKNNCIYCSDTEKKKILK